MRKWVFGTISVIGLAGFGYYQFYVYWQTFRFRMTVTVSTPEGRKSASSVIAVFMPRDMRTQGPTGIVPATTYGIAPIIGLGRYGTLIAALRSSRGDDAANKLSPTGSVEGAAGAGLIHAEYDISLDNVALSKAWRGGKRVLVERLYPQIVWIPLGVSNPNQARAFHPASLPQVIGADVRITSVTIEPTRDPLIERVPNAPEWLRKMRKRTKDKSFWERPPIHFNFYLSAVETARPSSDD